MRRLVVLVVIGLCAACSTMGNRVSVTMYECSQCGNVYYGYEDAQACCNATVYTHVGYTDSNGNVVFTD
jgi:hypothetical protein